MSQATDYVLANQSGASFRAELNTILAAVVSQNSGSSEPTITYAYMFWIDGSGSPALLKIRNGANSAWITIGDVTAVNLALMPKTGGAFTGDITLNTQSDLRFADSDSSNWIAFQAPATIAANVTLTLPAADGTSGQALSTNGSGTLSWASYAGLATAQTFTAAQRGSVSAQGTVSGTVTLDFATANNFSMTLSAGTVTLANPTNLTAGQSGAITITQDSGTARSLVLGSYFKFEAGTPTITTTTGALSTLFYYVDSSTRITAKLITNPTGA
jgi:hypothetical protein